MPRQYHEFGYSGVRPAPLSVTNYRPARVPAALKVDGTADRTVRAEVRKDESIVVSERIRTYVRVEVKTPRQPVHSSDISLRRGVIHKTAEVARTVRKARYVRFVRIAERGDVGLVDGHVDRPRRLERQRRRLRAGSDSQVDRAVAAMESRHV